MRQREIADGLTVNAIAGTHVVTLGLDLAEERHAASLGFAIHREDHTENERYWMNGMKTFRSTMPDLAPGGHVSSRDHPFQTFQWADYSAKPDHEYTYTVVSLEGTPAALREGPCVSVGVTTETEVGRPHSVFFNRGSLATQEYATRFHNVKPSELSGERRDEAYEWLSRGLLEAFVAFVGRASGARFGLYGAFYEFQWPAALAALRDASERGAEVRILYDGIAGTGPHAKNEAAIAAARLAGVCEPRTTGKLMHNKFLVLTEAGAPVAVWLGSMNLTENGIFGHANVGHIVDDAAIAAAYLACWTELCTNPSKNVEQGWMAEHNPSPPDPWSAPISAVFSPHRGLSVLDWYASIAGGAQRALFMTFAFGMHDKFQAVYERPDDVLRFALMDKEGSGRGLAQGRIDVGRIRRRPNVVVAVGNRIELNAFDRWLAECSGLTNNVQWVHTKFALVDPLSSEPVIITGSANFSEQSTNENNENMVVIRGDRRSADIYLGEFMRLYSHYAYREAVKIARERHEDWQPNYLAEDSSWLAPYFRFGQRLLRRRYFAGE